MNSTIYKNTFICASSDTAATCGEKPAKAESIAGLQYALLREKPYALTSDDLLFEIYAGRKNIADADRAREREAFFAKSQACLRASPLVKQYGWGLHHDADGRVAAYGIETEEYRELLSRPDVKVVSGMRSRRGP